MYVDKKGSKSTPFFDKVKQAIAADASKENLVKLGETYKNTSNYVKNFRTLKFPVKASDGLDY